jgi:hypothetical protein
MSVEQVGRPADRLTVRCDQIELIEAVAVRPVLHAGHDAVNRERGDGKSPAFLGRADDLVERGIVVYRVDEDAKDAPLAMVSHIPHLSLFAS